MDNLRLMVSFLQSEGWGIKIVIGKKPANQIFEIEKIDSAPNISQSKR